MTVAGAANELLETRRVGSYSLRRSPISAFESCHLSAGRRRWDWLRQRLAGEKSAVNRQHKHSERVARLELVRA